MAAHYIIPPIKVFKHKVELSRKTRKLSGYGKAKGRYYTLHDNTEKPSKERINRIREQFPYTA